ncbi:MAG: hypothetical protein HY704_11790 [Gemmatimonadetes bacterium]|nr:hypothetical protein [Gemmatimonadota bacterium]
MGVLVTNYNRQDIRVYVVRSGLRFRLGAVTSMNAAVFEIPGSVLGEAGEVQLLIDPIGGGWSHISDRILVQPGRTIEWIVNENPALSFPIVR